LVEKKISRRDLLQEPDEFITASGALVKFARERPRVIALGCALIFAAAIAATGLYTYWNHRISASNEKFMLAQANYKQAAFALSAPSSRTLDELFAEFDAIARDYSSLVAGERALLYSAHVLFMKKDYQGALERYTQMKSTSIVKKGLGDLVMYHIAMTRLAMKEYEAAKEIFARLSADAESPYRREACMSIAAIYEANDKKKEAVQEYNQYLKAFPMAPDASYVQSRIADLSTVD
jgi:predicted negative regulator of RcsB-dependent stress response